MTPNGRYAYTGNGGGNVTRFAVSPGGELTRLQADGLSGSSPGANDVAITSDGRDLYVINPGAGSITSFAVGRDGSLKPLPSTTGLPTGLTGLAAG